MKIYFLLILVCVCFITSCEKDEIPVAKFDRGDVLSQQISLYSNYKNQVWYKLKTNSIVQTNSKVDWDLAFSCNENSTTGIYLNTAKVMRAYRTNFTELSQVLDTNGYANNAIADSPTGELDSLAFFEWSLYNKVYIINRGYDESSAQLGFYKLKIIAETNTSITIEYAELSALISDVKTIVKNTNYNRVMFSFTSNETVFIEPPAADFDLCFTQYTHVYTNPVHYYQVTGVLNNQFNTKIGVIPSKDFNEIVIADTSLANFSSKANGIGYDWKTFSLVTNTFTIHPEKNYIIKDNEGFFYKLHFINFYNSAGIKGYPTFEFKKL